MPGPNLEPVVPGVFRCRGAVHVYVIGQGGGRVLVDLGDGGVLDRVGELGWGSVTDVLITHGHRTQFEGMERLTGTGVRVHVNPEAAVFRPDYVAGCLSELVPMRGKAVGRFELPSPPPPRLNLCGDLAPGSELRIGEVDFTVTAAPGHDPEQVALTSDIGGRRVCFAGDAIHSRGKVYELFSTDLDHYTGTGARQAADALAAIREAEPEVVLTSHGPGLVEDVAESLLITEDLLRAYAGHKDHFFPGTDRVSDLKEGRERPWGEDGPCRLSAHIWALKGNTYVITSSRDDRACLLVDVCGGAARATWRDLERIGTTRPEIILSTQYHLDHLPSAREKARDFPGAELWAQEAVAYVAENCERIRRPWLHDRGVECDRHLGDGEQFHWREHAFRAHFMPGQTDGHAGYSAKVDGRTVLFSGDNFYHPQVWGGYGGLCGFNGAWDPVAGYARSARLALELSPDWVLCEHDMAMEFRPELFRYALQWCDEVASLQAALSPDGDRARHCNPYLVSFEPFVMPLRPGETRALRVILDNRGSARARRLGLRACPPAGISVEPATMSLASGADEVSETSCRVLVADGARTDEPLTLVPFEVIMDGVPCGRRNAVFIDSRL